MALQVRNQFLLRNGDDQINIKGGPYCRVSPVFPSIKNVYTSILLLSLWSSHANNTHPFICS